MTFPMLSALGRRQMPSRLRGHARMAMGDVGRGLGPAGPVPGACLIPCPLPGRRAPSPSVITSLSAPLITQPRAHLSESLVILLKGLPLQLLTGLLVMLVSVEGCSFPAQEQRHCDGHRRVSIKELKPRGQRAAGDGASTASAVAVPCWPLAVHGRERCWEDLSSPLGRAGTVVRQLGSLPKLARSTVPALGHC